MTDQREGHWGSMKPHDGGSRPVSKDAKVRAHFRGAGPVEDTAMLMRWEHEGHNFDIIGYQEWIDPPKPVVKKMWLGVNEYGVNEILCEYRSAASLYTAADKAPIQVTVTFPPGVDPQWSNAEDAE